MRRAKVLLPGHEETALKTLVDRGLTQLFVYFSGHGILSSASQGPSSKSGCRGVQPRAHCGGHFWRMLQPGICRAHFPRRAATPVRLQSGRGRGANCGRWGCSGLRAQHSTGRPRSRIFVSPLSLLLLLDPVCAS